MNKIVFLTTLKLGDPATLPTAGKSIGELQSALLKLKLEMNPINPARKEMGPRYSKLCAPSATGRPANRWTPDDRSRREAGYQTNQA